LAQLPDSVLQCADINGVSAIIRGDKPNCEVAMDIDVGGFFKLLNNTIAMYN
jgi:hypothetical protein